MASIQCSGSSCDLAKLCKLGTDRITTVVGPEGSEAEFPVYADVAKRHSKVLETNIQLAIIPEKSKVRATEHSPEHFNIFVSFIYTGRIHTVVKSIKSSEWRLFSEPWVLGQALESTTFKDAVIDAMVERRAEFNETPQQTQIGVEKLIVDAAVSARKHDIYTDKLSSMPGCLHFYGEVIRGLDRIRRRVESEQEVLLRATKGLDCEYHEHGANEICHRKMFPATHSSVRHSQSSMPQIEKTMIENVAMRYSDVIIKAFAGGWKEAKENVIRLPEEPPEAFQVFVTFLDTGIVHLDHSKDTNITIAQEAEHSHAIDEQLNRITQSWLLAEHLSSTSFKDALVDKMLHTLHTTAEISKTMFPQRRQIGYARPPRRHRSVPPVRRGPGSTAGRRGGMRGSLEASRHRPQASHH